MKKILFIATMLMFGILSCFDGINDVYSSKSGPSMVFVSGGSFQRDGNAANISTVSSFYMSQFEVTRAQYVAVTGLADIPTFQMTKAPTTDSPRTMVSWYGALVFCNRLSMFEGRTPVYSISGSTNPSDWGTIPPSFDVTWNAVVANFNANGYRLPTEMEWMWAAMGGNSDRSNGNTGTGVNATGYTKGYAGSMENGSANANIGVYAVFGYLGSDAGHTTTPRTNPVGSKLPNELGLYDMSGNVWEWCWDWYLAGADMESYSNTIDGDQINYTGAPAGLTRVIRGGTYETTLLIGRVEVAKRHNIDPYGEGSDGGFRVVRR